MKEIIAAAKPEQEQFKSNLTCEKVKTAYTTEFARLLFDKERDQALSYIVW